MFTSTEENIDTVMHSQRPFMIELYKEDTIECLLKSIPIKDITDNIDEEVLFYNLEKTDALTEKYNISEYPCLLAFKSGELLGKIEGYYSIDEQADFEAEINKIIN